MNTTPARQTVLVTGGAGFIGSHLTEAFLTDGYRVVVLDNLAPTYAHGLKERNLQRCRDRGGGRFEFIEGSITDADCVMHDDTVVYDLPADWPDDGTIAPWAVVASLPFAPEIVLPALQHFNEVYPQVSGEYGFRCSFNPTFPLEAFSSGDGRDSIWISDGYYALDQGPMVLMIENYLTGFFWRLMRQCPSIVSGLRRAGFTGGWLGQTLVERKFEA
jgi:hypothetical protein